MSPSETCPSLFLIDETGRFVDLEIAYAVIRAFLKMCVRYPSIDTALMANWAEEVAAYLQTNRAKIKYPKTMAWRRLEWKIREHFKLYYTKDTSYGNSAGLEMLCYGRHYYYALGLEAKLQLNLLRRDMNERENWVLDMLLEGRQPAEIIAALGLSYGGGRHVLSNLKAKIRASLKVEPKVPEKAA